MNQLFLVTAILLMALAQVLRIRRWRLLSYEAEVISPRVISRSIGISYLGNIVLPFRLGEIVRIVYLGKNGYNYLMAFFAVLIERSLDAIFLSLIFGAFFIFSLGNLEESILAALFAAIAALVFLLVILLPSRVKTRCLGSFADSIQIRLVRKILQIYLNVKQIQLNLFAIISNSLIINSCIFLSIYAFSYYLGRELELIASTLVFELQNSILEVMREFADYGFNLEGFTLFFLIPIVILLAPRTRKMRIVSVYGLDNSINDLRNRIMPIVDSTNSHKYFREVIFDLASGKRGSFHIAQNEILNGAKLVDVLHGESGDHVFLVDIDGELIVRKSAYLDRRNFLEAQHSWLNTHCRSSSTVPVGSLVHTKHATYYDMEFLGKNSDFFSFLHSRTIQDSMSMLEELLVNLNVSIGNLNSKNDFDFSPSTYYDAYSNKIDTFFELIHQAQLFNFCTSPMVHNDILLQEINEESFMNFFNTTQLPTKDSWLVHGDLTVANLLVNENSQLIMIDPNPNQAFFHSTVDLGKLFQSFTCGFEFDFDSPKFSQAHRGLTSLNTRSLSYSRMELFLEEWVGANRPSHSLLHAKIQLLLHLVRITPYAKSRNQIIWIIFSLRKAITEINQGTDRL